MDVNKRINYRNIAFSEETRFSDFYRYATVKSLCSQCEANKEDMIKCRTVGILQSEHGKFWLNEIENGGMSSEVRLRVLVCQLRSLPSMVHPLPVQVFGSAQWRNRPAVYVTLIQVLPVPVALRIREVMNTVSERHLAVRQHTSEEDPT